MTKILVVDDNSDILELIDTLLCQQGYETVLCANGQQAARALKNDYFDAIITDIIMPEMDGLDFLKLLRNCQNASAPTPVIALSGGGASISSATALRAGKLYADEVMGKPFDNDELLEKLNRLIHRDSWKIETGITKIQQ